MESNGTQSNAQDFTSRGKIDSQDAAFTYHREPARKLSYRVESNEDAREIDGDRIIGVLPVHRNSSDEYTLLFVDVDPAEGDETSNAKKVEARTHFRLWTLTNPPASLVHDYVPSGAPCWQPRDSPSSTSRSSSSSDSESNLTVILSLGSGHGLARTVYDQLLRPFLAAAGAPPHALITTSSPSSITDFATGTLLPRANTGVKQCVVLLSGDGGVADLVNALLARPRSAVYAPPSVALLPLGTGNALAHSSGAARGRTLGLATLLRGRPVPLPLFRVRITPSPSAGPVASGASGVSSEGGQRGQRGEGGVGSESGDAGTTLYGAVVFSWGLHASLVGDSDTPAYRAHGAARFQMAARDLLFPADGGPPHAYKARVEVLRARPGTSTSASTSTSTAAQEHAQEQRQAHALQQEHEQAQEHWQPIPRPEHTYVLATLSSHLEATFTVSPASAPLDTTLRLLHFGPPAISSGAEIAEVMGAAYAGGAHVRDPRVAYEPVAGLRVAFDGRETQGRWRRVCVDGAVVEAPAQSVVEVRMLTRENVGDVLDLVHLDSDL